MITAYQMKNRYSRGGVLQSLIHKYCKEIEEALEWSYENPGTEPYIYKRIYKGDMTDYEHTYVVDEIAHMYKNFGYETSFNQENILTISWQ